MKQIKMTISKKSINKAIDDLRKYKLSLMTKNELFVTKLLEDGISIAEVSKGFYGMYIVFDKKVENVGSTTVGCLIGKDTKKLPITWNYYGHPKTREISPILFAEFGSGWLAEVLFDVPGVGQGSYPDQEHAFEPGGWSYMTMDGEWHHSKGFKPSHPMYKAELEMLDRIIDIAREVYGSDI